MTGTTERDGLKLLPCPFCGGASLSVRHHDIDGWMAYIQCESCDEVQGPSSEYKYDDMGEASADAAMQWNRRSDSTLLALVQEMGKALEPFANYAGDVSYIKKRAFLQVLICPLGDDAPGNYVPHFQAAQTALSSFTAFMEGQDNALRALSAQEEGK